MICTYITREFLSPIINFQEEKLSWILELHKNFSQENFVLQQNSINISAIHETFINEMARLLFVKLLKILSYAVVNATGVLTEKMMCDCLCKNPPCSQANFDQNFKIL